MARADTPRGGNPPSERHASPGARRQSDRTRAGVPRLWLLSDAARLPDPRAATRRLPAGSAVIARDLTPDLLPALAALCRARRLRLLVAGEGRTALRWGAGLHVPDRRPARHLLPFLLARRPGALLSVAAHGRQGIARGRRLRAQALILSPTFPTGSHPGGAALGPLRWVAVARRAGRPAIALGGMDARRARCLPPLAAGWAAIAGLAAPSGPGPIGQARIGSVSAMPQCLTDVAPGNGG